MDNSFNTIQEQQEPLPRKSGKRFIAVLAVLIAIGALFFTSLGAPADFPEDGTTFTIMQGDNAKNIGTELVDQHFIRSRFIFATLVSLFGGEHSISPGDYDFSKDHSVIGIARQIATGNHNIQQIKITVPEGMTISEIDALLSSKLPTLLHNDFALKAKGQEGYLFPETYFFYPKIETETIVANMRSMFDRQTSELFQKNSITESKQKNIVIMASLIEREAHGDDDRGTIAGILYNRLDIHMPLQVDATVAYAAGVSENNLKKADFSVDSPYNTYKYKGLPPGPISNPGLEALTAAVQPTASEYLYYLHDSRGTIHYAKTYKEHLANIKKYLR